MTTHAVFGVMPNQSESPTLVELIRARQQLDVQIHVKAREVFQPGRSVHWDHHGYPQVGAVIEVTGFPGYTEVRARNCHTGCVRQLALWELNL